MGIFGTLYIGYSGLFTDSHAMNVSADNITNLNTTGFKAGRYEFGDVIRNAVGEVFTRVAGYGATPKATRRLFSQGGIQTTDVPTDLAISGRGFFVVSDSKGNIFFTRDGQFMINEADEKNFALQNSLGMYLLGADPNAATAGIADLKNHLIPKVMPAKATSKISAQLLLNANRPMNAETLLSKYDWTADPTKPLQDGKYDWVFDWDIYDPLGQKITLKAYFDRGDKPNTYEVLLALADPTKDTRGDGKFKGAFLYGTLTFGGNGEVVSADFSQISDPNGTLSPLDLTTLGQPKFTLTVDGRTQEINLDLGFKVNPDGSITRLNYPTRLSANPFAQLYFSQDGYEEGVFDRIEVITEEGSIKAWYTNNIDLPMAKLFLAHFNGYEESLEKVGNNLFRAKANATPFIFAPGAGERARILSGALETSNTDLAQEMVHLILLQRAFQSNSRVIATADQMLEDFLRQR